MQPTEFEVLATDPVTGIPTPVQTSTAALREALIKNPSLLVGALREVLSQRYAAGSSTPAPVVTNETNIAELVAPQEATRLSANAKRLTRGDLMALAGWGGQAKKDPAQLGLDVNDIKTIREIFGRQLGTDISTQELELQWSISSCCCTPCCCCAVSGSRRTRMVA
jgi:hypothetical protein